MIHKQLQKSVRIGLPVLILLMALVGFGASSSLYADVYGSAATGVQSLESIQSSFRAVAQKVIPTVVEVDVVDVVKSPVFLWAAGTESGAQGAGVQAVRARFRCDCPQGRQ